MKPEVILFSRTPQKDYQYLLPLPQRLSQASRAFLQSQLEQMQGGKTDGIIHFFLSETDAVLLRLIDSGCKDPFSRSIYSLEGLYCPAEDIRKFWLCLPFWVPGFWSAPSLYQYLVRGESTLSVSPTQLLDDFTTRSRTQPHVPDMRTAVYAADAPVSFQFDADGFHPASELSTRGRTPWTSCETRRCSIQLTLLRKQKTAHLAAISSGAPAYCVLRSTEIPREADGWHFAALEASARAMEDELDARGWQYDKGDGI